MDTAPEVVEHQHAFLKVPKMYRSSHLLPSCTNVHRGVRCERRLIVLAWRLANPELLCLDVERETMRAEKRRRETTNLTKKERKE